jgi:hypothetical protein
MANDRLIDIAVTKVIVCSTAPAAPLAPTVTELTAGLDITAALTTGTVIDYADSDVVTEMSFADGQKIEAPSLGAYTVDLTMFRLFTSGTPGTNDPATIFTGNYPTLYVYKRTGLPSTTAVAASQKFDVFKITADRPKKPSGAGGFLKMMVKGRMSGFSGEATVAGP